MGMPRDLGSPSAVSSPTSPLSALSPTLDRMLVDIAREHCKDMLLAAGGSHVFGIACATADRHWWLITAGNMFGLDMIYLFLKTSRTGGSLKL